MLNPTLFIPYLIVPVLNQVIAYFVLYLGWVRIPSSLAFSYIPTFLNAFILTEDYKAIILVVLLTVMDALIWLPFLRLHAKQLQRQET